jgi:hypothetical protein
MTKPSIPNGQKSGRLNILYTYHSNASDPNNDTLFYLFDWGDGNQSGWLGPYRSGEICNGSHVWTKKGLYNVRVLAKDVYGNLSNWSEPLNINISKISLNIPLFIGWNLITTPLQNDYWASTLAKNISGCQMISWFDSVNQTFKTYIVGGPPSFDFPIVSGYGYFVLADQSSTLSISGYRIDNVSTPLSAGWNMIGWYHSSDTMASTLGGNISGCQMISWFDSVNQTFKTYIVGGPPSFDFTIRAGMGLFVEVNTASVWHGG